MVFNDHISWCRERLSRNRKDWDPEDVKALMDEYDNRISALESALREIADGVGCGCCKPGESHCDTGIARDTLAHLSDMEKS